MTLDLDGLTAIDMHVHVEADVHMQYALDEELRTAASKYFKGDPCFPASRHSPSAAKYGR